MPQTLPDNMTNHKQRYRSLPPQMGGEYQQRATFKSVFTTQRLAYLCVKKGDLSKYI